MELRHRTEASLGQNGDAGLISTGTVNVEIGSPPLEALAPQDGSKASGSEKANGSAKANGSKNGSEKANGSAKPNGSAPADRTPANGSGRVRTYEELDGAEGRAVFFRPHRFTAADFAPLRSTVTVSIAGALHECALRDVSQNGVAFDLPMDVHVRSRQRLHIVLRFDSHEAFRGEARVGSVREQDGSTVVGVSLDGALLDTDELLQLRDVRRWSPTGSALRVSGKPWHTPGNDRFKALVSDMRLFLEDAEEKLRDFEASLPWHVMQDGTSAARAALVSRVRADVGADVVGFAEEIDRALRSSDPADAAALKEFSLRQVHRFLMQAPWMHRARHKPFGYPGDYEVMNFVYEKDFEGPTLFARALGHAFLQTPPSLAVRRRKDLMVRQLRAVLESSCGSSRPVRFLSIAAGPARELQELLAGMDELPAPLEIVLFDQDKGALAHAYRRLRPLAEGRFPGRVRIVFLNESIKRLLRDTHLFDAFHSCGLFDYLHEWTAVGLARNLYSAAAPGGKVFIANMVDHPGRWFMEQHLEWELLYRTREELVDIGRRAAPEARIRVLEEETGVNPFIELARD
jgi:extracellular factor (EF) 3-hydroxypalmitic acid methyl ester biosynthesis protein